MKLQYTSRVALAGFLLTSSFANAHSWIEQLMRLAPNGTMVGAPGYPRGNVLRTAPGFNDNDMVFLIPPDGGPINEIAANQLMCRPSQTTQQQGADSPRLSVAPGQAVALRYQENGHVTLPQNTPGKPVGSGGNFVYYTTDSKPTDLFLQIHRQWNANGTGGDGRGRLISTRNFDDGQCYQINDGTISKQRQAEFPHEDNTIQGQALWCQQDVQIPADAKPGTTITLYWVWDWPTLPNAAANLPDGKQQLYTTCMDIDIVASPGSSKNIIGGFVKQDLANAAVSAQFSNVANPTAVRPTMIPFSNVEATSVGATSVQATSVVSTSVEGAGVEATPCPSSYMTTSTTDNTIISTPTTASSQVASATGIAGQVTVTVHETVTNTIIPTRTHKSTRPIDTVTDFVTVVVTETATQNQKQASEPTSVAVKPVSCSTTERAFKLRARNPFYILPSQDVPGPTAGGGC